MTVEREWRDPLTGIEWTAWLERGDPAISRGEGYVCFRSDAFKSDRRFRTYQLIYDPSLDLSDEWMRELLLKALESAGLRESYETLKFDEAAGG